MYAKTRQNLFFLETDLRSFLANGEMLKKGLIQTKLNNSPLCVLLNFCTL